MGFILLMLHHAVMATMQPGQLFNLSTAGATGLNLVVTTNVTPKKSPYYYAGIQGLSYSFSGCTYNAAHTYCQFNVNLTQSPLNLAIQGVSSSASAFTVKLCINGRDNGINCEHHTASLPGLAYITNHQSQGLIRVSLCTISSDGRLSDCQNAGITNMLRPRQIVLNHKGTLAYIVDDDQNAGAVNACAVNQTTGQLNTGCTESRFAAPRGIAFTDNEQYAYVPINNQGPNGQILFCKVDINTGVLNDCEQAYSPVSSPTGIALHTFATKTLYGSYIYFSSTENATGAVTYCKVNLAVPGGVTDCKSALMDLVDPGDLEAITLNPAGTYAYLMESPERRILVCSINPSSAALQNCTPTAENLVVEAATGGVV